jgi:hypothetical protein
MILYLYCLLTTTKFPKHGNCGKKLKCIFFSSITYDILSITSHNLILIFSLYVEKQNSKSCSRKIGSDINLGGYLNIDETTWRE